MPPDFITMKLSERLTRIYEMTGITRSVADIGSDHGLLPVALIKNKQCGEAISSDISDKALAKARRNIKKYSAEGIDVRVGDGLSVLYPGEAETIIIAGMGGELMSGILDAGAEKLSGSILILSPNNAEDQVRAWLEEHGYTIYDEDIIYEKARFYQIMAVRRGNMTLTQNEREFGPINLQYQHPLLTGLIKKRIDDAKRMKLTAQRGSSERSKKAQIAANDRLDRYKELLECVSPQAISSEL